MRGKKESTPVIREPCGVKRVGSDTHLLRIRTVGGWKKTLPGGRRLQCPELLEALRSLSLRNEGDSHRAPKTRAMKKKKRTDLTGLEITPTSKSHGRTRARSGDDLKVQIQNTKRGFARGKKYCKFGHRLSLRKKFRPTKSKIGEQAQYQRE